MHLGASLAMVSSLFGVMASQSLLVSAKDSTLWTPNTVNDPEYKGCYAKQAMPTWYWGSDNMRVDA